MLTILSEGLNKLFDLETILNANGKARVSLPFIYLTWESSTGEQFNFRIFLQEPILMQSNWIDEGDQKQPTLLLHRHVT